MVVDGRAELVGSDTNAAPREIERSLTSPHGVVRIDVDSDESDVGRPNRLKVVAFVQELRGRTILASASVSLQNARR